MLKKLVLVVSLVLFSFSVFAADTIPGGQPYGGVPLGKTLMYGSDGSSYYVPGVNSSGALLVTDSGATRSAVSYYALAAAAGTTGTETAITLTRSLATGATTTGTSFVITSGKKFRITHLSVASRGHATPTAQVTTFSLRLASGATTTTSTPVVFSARSATAAVASDWDRYTIPIPDGFEITGNGTLQFGITAAATYTTNAPTWDVNILGYEY